MSEDMSEDKEIIEQITISLKISQLNAHVLELCKLKDEFERWERDRRWSREIEVENDRYPLHIVLEKSKDFEDKMIVVEDEIRKLLEMCNDDHEKGKEIVETLQLNAYAFANRFLSTMDDIFETSNKKHLIFKL